MRFGRCKRGEVISKGVIRWILYLAILVAAGFAVRNMIGRFAG